MSERGYIAVDRGLFDHPSFASEPFTEREAWLWMICEAAWKPCTVRVGRARIALERGQLAFSLRYLATRWRWSEASVRRFLARLSDRRTGDALIDALATREATQITICKYDKYQQARRTDDAPTDAPVLPKVTQRITNNQSSSLRSEDGERGREREHPAFSRFWSAYPRRDGSNPRKPAADKFASKIRDGTDPEEIIRGAEAYARSMSGRDARYVAQAVTWLNQHRWTDEHAEPSPTIGRQSGGAGRAERQASPDSVFYATLARHAAEPGAGGWPSDADRADSDICPRGFAGTGGGAEVVALGPRNGADGGGRGWSLALDAPPVGRRDIRGGFG